MIHLFFFGGDLVDSTVGENLCNTIIEEGKKDKDILLYSVNSFLKLFDSLEKNSLIPENFIKRKRRNSCCIVWWKFREFARNYYEVGRHTCPIYKISEKSPEKKEKIFLDTSESPKQQHVLEANLIDLNFDSPTDRNYSNPKN